jgi:hypothetical protein
MKILNLGVACFCLTAASCRQASNEAQVRETVLSQGQTVEATNKNGKIRISYVSPTQRRYEWDDQQRVLRLKARLEPFDGRLGIYEPANEWDLFGTKTRLIVQEAIRKFENEDQIKAALAEGGDYMDWVYTNDGTVVGFGRMPARRQISVDLWQFLVQGKKPSNLIGARADHIVVRKATTD